VEVGVARPAVDCAHAVSPRKDKPTNVAGPTRVYMPCLPPAAAGACGTEVDATESDTSAEFLIGEFTSWLPLLTVHLFVALITQSVTWTVVARLIAFVQWRRNPARLEFLGQPILRSPRGHAAPPVFMPCTCVAVAWPGRGEYHRVARLWSD
jgi:hypothetical protein